MDLPVLFEELLLAAKPKPSSFTVKNYVSDLRNFIQWYEQRYQAEFIPQSLNKKVMREYESDSKLSTASRQRRIAALKKFYSLLETKGITTPEPFTTANPIPIDPWRLKEFKMQLHLEKVSPLTVKNYVLDVASFKQWAQQLSPSITPSTITSKTIDSYRDRMIQILRLSPASVNRKQSSIRRYLAFLHVNISTSQSPEVQESTIADIPLNKAIQISLSNLAKKERAQYYSSFPPLRLIQRLVFSIGSLEDIVSDHAARTIRQKQVKQRLLDMIARLLPRSSFTNSLLRTPKSIQKSHIIFVSILLVLASMFLIKHLYDLNANIKKQVLGIESSVNSRILSFSGRLTDQNGNPITEAQPIRFAIYTNSVMDQPRIWQETQIVKPGPNGQFQVSLGQINPIPASIFSQEQPLYLGVKIGSSPELTPRQQLVSTSYAADSQSLQGMTPITSDNAGSQNVILALDSSGNLTIGDHANPKFQATEGNISLSGNSTIISTNAGSNGDIQLSPDGTGMIDVQAPIHNSTQNGAYPGAVEIADTTLIQSSELYQPSLIVNNAGFGDIFTASASGITKFIITRSGSVGIGTANPTTMLDVNGDVAFGGTTRLNNVTYQWPSISGQNGYVLTTDGLGNLTWTDGSTLPNAAFNVTDGTAYDVSRNVLIGASSATSSAAFAFLVNGPSLATASFSGNLVFSGGNSTITTTAMTPLQIGDNTTGSINFQNAGNVGIGTTTPQFKLDVNGTANISGDVNIGSNLNVVGLTSHNADFAEYVKAEVDESIPYGALICLDSSGLASECTTGGHIIGAASEHPAFLGNANNNGDSVAVGLIGQIPVKVSTENGPIQAGDPVGASSIPGVGVKAITAGYILGHALASSSQAVNGEITVLVQPSWYDPDVYLSKAGELHINGDETVSPLNPILGNSQTTYTVTSYGQVITRAANFAQATIGTLFAGLIDAQQVVVQGSITAQTIIAKQLQVTSDNVLISGISLKDYIAQVASQLMPFRMVNGKPQVFADQVATNIISPLADDSHIAISLTNSQLQIKKDSSSSAVASFDTQGNATLSGTLTAQAASVSGFLSQNATVSGTLRAGTIIADSIQGLDQQVATIAADYLNQHEPISPTPTPANRPSSPSTDQLALINTSNSYADIASISADFGMFNQSLISMGTTTLRDATIMDQLSIGTGFIIGENSLDTIGQDLQIEPLKQGNISFMAGLVSIDTKGDLKIGGNATFAQNVTVNGSLAANIISPLPDQDLTVNLGKKSDGTPQSLQINNGSKMPVFSVNGQGDVYATGSAYFGQNLVASGAALLSKLNIFPAKAEAVSDTEVVASGSAGTTILHAYEREITIDTPAVTANSLIYITPQGNTNNQVLYLERQVPGKSFTVGIEQTTYNDIPFNWIIIN